MRRQRRMVDCLPNGHNGEEESRPVRRAEAPVRDVKSAKATRDLTRSSSRRRTLPRTKRRRRIYTSTSTVLCVLLASGVQTSMAQKCISLAKSTTCPAFNAASVSTDSSLVGLFPFLSSVTDTTSFDSGLRSYIGGGFAQLRYVC